jgi:hypothetical protein
MLRLGPSPWYELSEWQMVSSGEGVLWECPNLSNYPSCMMIDSLSRTFGTELQCLASMSCSIHASES